MFQTKGVAKNKTHILCSTFFPENGIMSKNMIQRDRPQMTIQRSMRTACLVTKVTDTHTECVIFIGFPLQQWLTERASIYVTRTLLVLFWCSSVHLKTGPDENRVHQFVWHENRMYAWRRTKQYHLSDVMFVCSVLEFATRTGASLFFEEWSGRPPPPALEWNITNGKRYKKEEMFVNNCTQYLVSRSASMLRRQERV